MKKRIFCCILALLMLSSFASCGKTDVDPGEKDTETETDSAVVETSGEESETEKTYAVPDANYDGYTFRILNTTDDMWDCYNKMDVEEIRGELLDDAVFNRNAKLESDLNIEISVSAKDLYDLNKEVLRAVRTDDAVYDVAYLKCDLSADVLAENAIYNLYDLEKLQLTEPWYDQYVREDMTIKDKLFFITNANQLMATSLLTTMYFNKTILTDNGLDEPYALVREGKWTLDAVYTYVSAVTNMGTQTSWKWDEHGDATYGIVLHNGLYRNMFCGTGEKLVTIDASGIPTYNTPGERFYAILEKMSKTANNVDGYVISQHDCDCSLAFQEDRVLFRYYELQQILSAFGDMESDFGVVPSPKYDEAQENYVSMISQQTAVMSIPVTNTDLDRTGTIIDYMSYLSYTDLWPAFIEQSVTNRGLRDEDSVEMLNIIRSTTYIDAGMAYRWTNEMVDKIYANVKTKKGEYASIVAKYADSIPASIEKSLKDMGI